MHNCSYCKKREMRQYNGRKVFLCERARGRGRYCVCFFMCFCLNSLCPGGMQRIICLFCLHCLEKTNLIFNWCLLLSFLPTLSVPVLSLPLTSFQFLFPSFSPLRPCFHFLCPPLFLPLSNLSHLAPHRYGQE